MTTFFRGAIALGALGGPLLASSGGTSDWLGLDEELNSLASTVTLQGNEPNFGGLLRTNLLISEDFSDAPGAEDLFGVDITDAKLWAQGDVGEIGWRVMFDFANFRGADADLPTSSFPPGTPSPVAGQEVTFLGDLFSGSPGTDYSATLQEAYASWNLSESLKLTVGRFRTPSTRSARVPSEQLLFLNRSLIGDFGYVFDDGAMLSGAYDNNLSWWLSAQNGFDGVENDLRYNARVQYAFGLPTPTSEGAYVSTEEVETTVGAFYGDEGQFNNGSYFGGDVTANYGPFSFYGEVVNFSDDWAGALAGRFGTDFSPTDGATPWSTTFSYMLEPETWELAVRYEELDDASDTSLLTFGANYYVAGHNAKWQLNIADISSDVDAQDGLLVGLGFVIGLEGYDTR